MHINDDISGKLINSYEFKEESEMRAFEFSQTRNGYYQETINHLSKMDCIKIL